MRLCRTNLVAVLTIMAGGAIGGLFTFGPSVLWSPTDDVADQVTFNAQAALTPLVIDSGEAERIVLQNDSTFVVVTSAGAFRISYDELGSTEYNRWLGNRRAESVREFLLDHGIAADRFAMAWFARGAASGRPE